MGRAFEYRRAAKEKRWDKMSKMFPKLAKAITMAAKEGSSDPTMNSSLRTAIQNAKSENMPKDNIAAAIKRAEGKDAEDLTNITYEGKGAHGVLVFIVCASDNTTRTIANVKAIFSKSGGEIVSPGSLNFMFNHKAVFEFEKTEELDIEELELELIDAGMEDIEIDENLIYVYGDFKSFGALSNKFEELKVEIKRSSLKWIANSPVEFSEEQLEEIEELIDKLEDDEDVQAVFTNIA